MAETHTPVDEKELPALYMLHTVEDAPMVAIGEDYDIVTLPTELFESARFVIELDGTLSERAWESFGNALLPDGLFVARSRKSGEWVGTASALHNPTGSRFYFPSGGELGYLTVYEAHRRHGVGHSLVAAVVARFRTAGYHNLWLGVQGWRLPAIRVYLRAGYRPFLHGPNAAFLLERWQRIFGQLAAPALVSEWPRELLQPLASHLPVNRSR